MYVVSTLDSLAAYARFATIAIVVCVGWVAPAYSVDASTRVEFSIHEQSGDKALTAFAEQAGLTVLFPYDAVSRVTANELVGVYQVADGLEILLAGTGLQASIDDNNRVTVRVQGPGGEVKVRKAKRRFFSGLLGAVGAGASVGGVVAQPADQANAPGQNLDEVLVTGTRIVRQDFEANSPIVTLDGSRFEETSTVGMESVLNQLPQFVPAVTQFNVGSEFYVQGGSHFADQLSVGATRTPGQATLSLRGLGPNRNLVLLDGRRPMPINASMAVSINTIPSAAIERVETITGGASSVYGADAVAGVVNFITKQNFQGIDLDAQVGETAEGDGTESRFSAVMGANFADGGGNVLLGFERSERSEILESDRDFIVRGFADPSATAGGTSWGAAGYVPVAGNLHSAAVVAQIFADAPGPVTNTGNFFMNSDGTLYKTTVDGAYRYNGPWLDERGIVRRKVFETTNNQNGQLRDQSTGLMMQIPLERYSLFGRGQIDLSDDLRAFAQVLFSESKTKQSGMEAPLSGGWRARSPHGDGLYEPSVDQFNNTLPEYLPGGRFGLECPAVGGCTKSQAFPKPPELMMLLDSRPNREADWEFAQTVSWSGARRNETTVMSYQLIGGLEGSLPIRDWTWEFYASSGSTLTESLFDGVVSLERYRLLVSQPNYGRGMSYTGNAFSGAGVARGFAAGTITCTSGYPVAYGVSGYYEYFVPSQDCQDAIGATAKSSSHMRQNVVEYNMQGGLADLPAGELRFALGTGIRENEFQFNPDVLNSQESVLDQLAGFFPVGRAYGKTEAKEIYGELLVPVLADVWGVQGLNLELGYRWTDNDPSNNVDTWKALIDWRVVDRVRVRGGVQLANRAPNIGELFQASEQSALITTTQGDPCSELNPAALHYTANPNLNSAGPATAARVKDLCVELMGPSGALFYYDNPQPNAFMSSRISNLSGTPTLRSEEAETTTLGVVANLTDRASLTLDYWRIEVDDMIAPQVPDVLYLECLSFETNPNYEANHPSCQLIRRSPDTGAVAAVGIVYTNEASADLAGYDLQFDWGGNVGPGMLTVNALATITGHTKTRVNDDAQWIDYKGTTGPSDVRGINQFAYDYRLFTTIGYRTGNWDASLRWRHLPSIQPEAARRTPVQYYTTPSYDVFDTSGRYAFPDGNWELRFGIDNLLDVEPRVVNTTQVSQGFSGLGTTNPAFYDLLGRRYYLGMKFQF